MDPLVKVFIDEFVTVSDKSIGLLLSEFIGCILEDHQIEVVRWMMNPWRQTLFDILKVKKIQRASTAFARVPQKAQYHNQFPVGTSQYKMRLFIGKCIFSRDPAFRRWLREY